MFTLSRTLAGALAFVALSTSTASWAADAAGATPAYSVSALSGYPNENPWTLKRQDIQPPVLGPGVSFTSIYTLRNSATGEVQSFTRVHSRLLSDSVNSLGQVLVTTGDYQGLHSAELLDKQGGHISSFSNFSGYLTQGADGSISGEFYGADGSSGYQGQYIRDGRVYTLAKPGQPGSSKVTGVNASGVVVGTVTALDYSNAVATMRKADGSVVALSSVPSATYGSRTWANAINDQGWVLGAQGSLLTDSRALIWDPSGQMIDLNDRLLTGPVGAVHLKEAMAFLQDGSIWARGYALNNPSVPLNFKLSVGAVPEPGTWALMGLGLVGVGAVARRRQGAQQPA
ncbi:MAG: hypothetical protein RI907_3411 [Pseudomonadota bacterium]|jgi:hypothetical protein